MNMFIPQNEKKRIYMNILIIAAHPDDEVLGCGGSMAKWSKNGNEVHILIMAEGVTSRDKQRNRRQRIKDLSTLAESCDKARDILSANSIELLDYPDNRMDSIDLLDVVKSVEKKIKRLKSDVVVTHHGGDLNIDHRITHQAVITACRPFPEQTVKRILSFEVPSSTEWQSASYMRPFVPNIYEDITETLDLKIEALKAYESEMRTWPHARSLKGVEHLARLRGASVGYEAAESFMLIRELN
tara:strand:+ start:21572 stop:22297 length:726 start_codon:yes stop_codon:yes gene_type:complete